VERQSADYRQLRDRVVAMILDGVLKEGDPLPLCAMSRPNMGQSLTVLKAIKNWSTSNWSRAAGRGMFVNTGARDLLMRDERRKFW